ncbi:MAG: serine/threonine protein kinase [Candidatus Hydrogenedentes bacterium]|nr:serine/threonine protein kinase [Candidatus Hydrogenedentota bacterium]
MNDITPANDGLTGHRIGQFQVARRLGAGGMGEVYLARDVSLGRPVALKVLRPAWAREPQLVERFHREARAAAQLSHPHIVQIYAVGTTDTVTYIAMEFVQGAALDSVLRQHGALPWQRALSITGQIASALEMAHARGIIHRDIKPANILIDQQGRARVTDFGVAKVIGANTQLTTDGTLIGTPEYMSPEQCGLGKVTPASDLFSLGAMLYEMLTGSLPFTGETYAGVIRSVTQDTPRPLDDLVMGVPNSVVFIVGKLLEKDPARRYATATELIEDLSRIASGSAPLIDVTAQPVAALPPPRAKHRPLVTTKTIGMAAALVVVAVGIAAVGLSARSDSGASPATAPTPAADPGQVEIVAPATQTAVAPLGPPAGMPGPPPPLSAREVLTRHDLNLDGQIVASELPAEVRPHLMMLDTDRDGVLTLKELEAAPQRRPPPQGGPGAHPPPGDPNFPSQAGAQGPPPPPGAQGFGAPPPGPPGLGGSRPRPR